MDKKSFAIFAVSFGLLLAWPAFVGKFFPAQEPSSLGGTNELSGVLSPVGDADAGSVEQVEQLGGDSSVANDPPSMVEGATEVVVPASVIADERTTTLENDSARYQFSSLDGGIRQVDLTRYPTDTGCGVTSEAESDLSEFAQLNQWNDRSILALRLGESELVTGFDISEEADRVTMTRSLSSGLRVEKVFSLSTNYLVRVTTRIVNESDSALTVPSQAWTIGTASPLSPEDNGLLLGTLFHNGDDVELVKDGWFANRFLGCFPGEPRSTYSYDASPIKWGSVANQFFSIALIPGEGAKGIRSTQTNLALDDEIASQFKIKKGIQAELFFDSQILQPNEAIEQDFNLFAGPKEYNTLARLSSTFGTELDVIMDFDGFFGFFAKALLLSMNGLHGFGLSYGFAIVAITFIIKLLFWPLTQASTRSMKRMAALQPQMKELQEKYKEDPQKMNRKLMEFMRENRVSPLGGCLPILLQLPVFFGFYKMLQSAIELRGASFLWTCDLSKPDTLFIIPGLELPFNLWPILMGAAQLWQMSMTPPSPGMDPAQQKIMKYMPLMFVFILYNFSAGLALYWTVQNLLSIVQMKLTKNEPVVVTSGAPQGRKKSKAKKGRPGR